MLGNVIARVIDELGTDGAEAALRDADDRAQLGRARWCSPSPTPAATSAPARTKARHVEGDVYELEGVKRFITNGDFDRPGEHRPHGAGAPRGRRPGHQGPVDVHRAQVLGERGRLARRAQRRVCTNVEHKMGIKALGDLRDDASATARPGARPAGRRASTTASRQMFHVIEHARMAVGMKSMATLSTAYLNALEYTQDPQAGRRPAARPPTRPRRASRSSSTPTCAGC